MASAAVAAASSPPPRGSGARARANGSGDANGAKRPSLALEFLTSSIGVATATTITQPIDLVKTRMQLELLQQQRAAAASSAAAAAGGGGPPPSASTRGAPRRPAGTGLFATAAGVVRREGVLALWGGAAPAAIRGLSYGGLRLGLYGPLRDALAASAAAQGAPPSSSSSSSSSSAPPAASFGVKLTAGAASGALAAAITSPTELIKVRMQAGPSSPSSGAAGTAAAATTKQQPAAAPGGASAPRASSSGGSSSSSSSSSSGAANNNNHARPPPPPMTRPGHYQPPQVLPPAGMPGMACSASASPSPPGASAVAAPPHAGGGGLRALSSSAAAAPRDVAGISRLRSIVRQVVAEDGVQGLWRGATPGMIRAAVLTASQCATYDAAKRRLAAATGLPDESLALQTGCALLTGLASTTATQPIDVVKTHMFVTKRAQSGTGAAGAGGSNGGGGGGVAATARAIWAQHGALGFLRGWTANYARLGPMTVLIFTTTELLRKQLGMASL